MFVRLCLPHGLSLNRENTHFLCYQQRSTLHTGVRVALSRFFRLCVPLVVLCLASVFLPTPVDAAPVSTNSPGDVSSTPFEQIPSWREPLFGSTVNHPLRSPSPVQDESMWAAAARGSAGSWPASSASLNTLSKMDEAPSSIASNPPPSPYLAVQPSMLSTPPLSSPKSASPSFSHTKSRAPPTSPYWVPGNTSSAAAGEGSAGRERPAAVGWQCSDDSGHRRPCHILLVSIGLHDHVVPLARLAAKLQSRVSESRV